MLASSLQIASVVARSFTRPICRPELLDLLSPLAISLILDRRFVADAHDGA